MEFVDFAIGVDRRGQVFLFAGVDVDDGGEFGDFVVGYAVGLAGLGGEHSSDGGVDSAGQLAGLSVASMSGGAIVFLERVQGSGEQAFVLGFLIEPKHDFDIADVSAQAVVAAVG